MFKRMSFIFLLALLVIVSVTFAVNSMYSVSGYVKYANGIGISGVTIYFSNGAQFVTTNSEGYWSQSGLSGNVIIIPSMKGYTFSPSSINVSNSASNINFTASYNVSGYVKFPDGNGISNVVISFSNGASSVTTNSQGYWSQTGMSGTVVIVPTLAGYTFEASEISVNNPKSDLNFLASYKIAGYVRSPDGKAIPNVAISFSNGASPVMTNSQGYWTKSRLSGTVVVKPFLEGYTFKPSNISLDAPNDNLSFKAYYNVAGYVKDLNGNGIPNVTVSFSNGAPSVVTTSDGYWSQSGLSGKVKIIPSLNGYTFNASQISIDGPSTCVNFTASYSISGYVKTPNGAPLQDVTISFGKSASPVTTNSQGYWSQTGLSGTVVIVPALAGYTFKASSITLNNPRKDVNFVAYYDVSGYIRTLNGIGIPNVVVSFSNGASPTTTDIHGYWSQTGLSGTVVVKPSLKGYTFNVPSIIVKGPDSSVNFTAFYILSGYVKYPNGMGVPFVNLSFSNGASSVTTDFNGYWSKDGLSGNVIVIPSESGYVFTPFSTYVNGPNNNVNFTASYTLSGYIKDSSGAGIQGVNVSFSNGASSVVTNSQGYWSQSGLSGIVVITPTLNGYAFDPSSVSANSPNNYVNFTASYSISGYVENPYGTGISGVPISFSNSTSTVVTNSQGYWSKKGLSGVVIVTPLLKGYSFNPFSVAINGAKNNIDFIASYNISGYIKSPNGSGISGVTVSFSNGASSVTTDPQGYWTENGLNGTVTVKPYLNGYMFNPSDISVIGPKNDVNFTGYQFPPYSPSIYVPITLTNNQSFQTPIGFQQKIVFNAQPYVTYESWDLGNVRFYDDEGNPLYSWLESGGLSSTSVTIWVKLDQPIPAHGSITIKMKFLKPGTEFDGKYAGEAPNLTQPYGEYDNGSKVFFNYQNFSGTTIPTGWYVGNVNGGDPTINNGIYFSLYYKGGNNFSGEQWVGSNWPVDPSLLYNEVYAFSENTNNFGGGGNNGQTANTQIMLMVSSAVPTMWLYQSNSNSVGYQNGSGLEISSNWGGGFNPGKPSQPIPNVIFQANPNPQLPAVIGVYANKLYSNYNQIGSLNQNILPEGYLAFDNNLSSFGWNWNSAVPVTTSFIIYWVRQRIVPPNNVMPMVSVGPVM